MLQASRLWLGMVIWPLPSQEAGKIGSYSVILAGLNEYFKNAILIFPSQSSVNSLDTYIYVSFFFYFPGYTQTMLKLCCFVHGL